MLLRWLSGSCASLREREGDWYDSTRHKKKNPFLKWRCGKLTVCVRFLFELGMRKNHMWNWGKPSMHIWMSRVDGGRGLLLLGPCNIEYSSVRLLAMRFKGSSDPMHPLFALLLMCAHGDNCDMSRTSSGHSASPILHRRPITILSSILDTNELCSATKQYQS